MPPLNKTKLLPPQESPRTSGDFQSSSPTFSRNTSTASSQASASFPSIKCVVVGDSATGKTSLISRYSRPDADDHQFGSYVPTTFDNYAVSVTVENKPIKVQLCDTSGQDEFSSLRSVWFSDADVFLLCYSTASRASLESARTKWSEEIRRFCPGSPIVLVGLQSDRRDSGPGGAVPREVAASAVDEIPNCVGLVECSSVDSKVKVKEAFDLAIFAALDHHGFVKRRRGLSSFRCKKYKCKSEMWTGSPPGSLSIPFVDSSQVLCRKERPYLLKALFSCFCGQE